MRQYSLRAGVARLPSLKQEKGQSQSSLRAFFRDVHRAYAKTQHFIAKKLCFINAQPDLSEGERLHRQLVYRKLADAMAFTMALGRTHVIRRLSVNESPQDVPIDKLPEYLRVADELNAQSRQTFALISDLTTFVHVGDLLRVDLRSPPHKLTSIELKAGSINERLLAQLDGLPPSEEAIASLKSRTDIAPNHIRQAQRMLRQRLRAQQIERLLATDEGHDPGLGMPMRLSEVTIVTTEYDASLSKLLDSVTDGGSAHVTVDGCIHLGIHSALGGADWRIAAMAAMAGLRDTANNNASTRGAGLVSLGIRTDDGHHVFHTDPYEGGLFAPAVRPFCLWNISPRHREALMTKRVRIATLVDLVGLATLFGNHGLILRYTSRRDAAQYAREVGGSRLALFENRALAYSTPKGEVVLMKGTFSRFMYELVRPNGYIAGVRLEDEPT